MYFFYFNSLGKSENTDKRENQTSFESEQKKRRRRRSATSVSECFKKYLKQEPSNKRPKYSCSVEERVLRFVAQGILPLQRNEIDSITSGDVDFYGKLTENRRRNWEANHIPADAAFTEKLKNKKGITKNDIVAHYIPKALHIKAMTKVGTSKSSKVSINLRHHQKYCIDHGRLEEAIALDIVANYGRANWFFANYNAKTVATSYWPAIIAYRKDLHAVINLYRNNNVYPRITNEQANRLHGIIEDIIKGYEDNAEEMTPEVWFKCIEEEYGKHLCDKNTVHETVKPEYYYFGK